MDINLTNINTIISLLILLGMITIPQLRAIIKMVWSRYPIIIVLLVVLLLNGAFRFVF